MNLCHPFLYVTMNSSKTVLLAMKAFFTKSLGKLTFVKDSSLKAQGGENPLIYRNSTQELLLCKSSEPVTTDLEKGDITKPKSRGWELFELMGHMGKFW